MELVHVVVDGLIHGLHPAGDVDLAAEAPGLVDTGQPFELADEGKGLFRRDELGGLHAVHQQLQLRQLKAPGGHEVAAAAALAAADDIHSGLPQGLDVRVDALALGLDAPLGQHPDDPGSREGMLLVGVLQQELPQGQDLFLLMGGTRHPITPFLPSSITLGRGRCKAEHAPTPGSFPP